jgi:hypothetical protein
MFDGEMYREWSEYATGMELRWGQYLGECLYDTPASEQPGEAY